MNYLMELYFERDVDSMISKKIINMEMLLLLSFMFINILLQNTKVVVVNSLIINSIFSFIFPAFIFLSFWNIALKRQNEKISIGKYYLKVLLNVVLPYSICMIPYIIYEYDVHNIKINDFVKLLITGDISILFIYVKSFISLLIIYPLIEYLVKLNKKVTIIASFILSAIFNLFHFDLYFIADIFNYLIYIAIGVSFAYSEKDVILLLRKSKKNFISYVFEIALLMFVTTKFEIYRDLSSVIAILYNILIFIIMSFLCYRYKLFYSRLIFGIKGYLTDMIIYSPIIAVTVFLLSDIVITLTKVFVNKVFMNIRIEVIQYGALLLFAIFFIIVKKGTVSYYNKHKGEVYKENK